MSSEHGDKSSLDYYYDFDDPDSANYDREACSYDTRPVSSSLVDPDVLAGEPWWACFVPFRKRRVRPEDLSDEEFVNAFFNERMLSWYMLRFITICVVFVVGWVFIGGFLHTHNASKAAVVASKAVVEEAGAEDVLVDDFERVFGVQFDASVDTLGLPESGVPGVSSFSDVLPALDQWHRSIVPCDYSGSIEVSDAFAYTVPVLTYEYGDSLFESDGRGSVAVFCGINGLDDFKRMCASVYEDSTADSPELRDVSLDGATNRRVLTTDTTVFCRTRNGFRMYSPSDGDQQVFAVRDWLAFYIGDGRCIVFDLVARGVGGFELGSVLEDGVLAFESEHCGVYGLDVSAANDWKKV